MISLIEFNLKFSWILIKLQFNQDYFKKNLHQWNLKLEASHQLEKNEKK